MLFQPINLDYITKPLVILEQSSKQEPQSKLYIVKENDTLTKIAQDNQTTVERLWEKNTDLISPDLIEPNKKLKIPDVDEKLVDRPLPELKPIVQPIGRPQSQSATIYSNSSGAYGVGWCTSYAAARHPVPNNLGNADTWLIMARQDGLSTGSIPQVGAIAVAAGYSHVAIVEEIKENKILISEQNYQGYGVVSQRWAPLSEWQGFIY